MSLTGIFSNFYLNSDSDNLFAININEATSVMFCIIILNSFPEPKYGLIAQYSQYINMLIVFCIVELRSNK